MRYLLFALVFFALLPVAGASGSGVTVIVDFGNGVVLQGQVQWHENISAFEATYAFVNETGLEFSYSVSEYGVMVNSIGGFGASWPGPWWHLFTLENGSWEASPVSCDQLVLEEGDTVAWAFYQDPEGWPNISQPSILPPWGPTWFSAPTPGEGEAPDLSAPAWSVHVADWGVQTTAAVVEGRVVVNSWEGALVLDPETGEVLARVQGTYGLSQPTGYGQYFLLGTGNGVALYRLDGTKVWETDTLGVLAGGALPYYGVFYFGTANLSGGPAALYAVWANGTVMWSVELDESSYFSAPAAMGDLIVFPLAGVYDPGNFSFSNGGVLLVNRSTGEVVASFSGFSVSCVPLVEDNAIYVTSREGFLHKLVYENGSLEEEWRVMIRFSTSSPISTNYGILVGWGSFQTGKGGLVLVTRDGMVRWRAGLGAVQSKPLLLSNNTVIATTNTPTGRVYVLAFTEDDYEVMQQVDLGNYVLSSPSYSNGWVFLGCDDGNLYAFAPGPSVPEFGTVSLMAVVMVLAVLRWRRR